MKSTQLTGLALMAGMLAGCGLFASKKDPSADGKPGAGAPELVGRIASIPADKRFVLIQSYGTWKIEPGTVLTTRGPEERSANLLVTGESLGQFAAADLQSGTVDIGDAVYSRHSPKPKDPPQEPAPEPELPETQETNETGNVQKNI
jgi:hypothetical protein